MLSVRRLFSWPIGRFLLALICALPFAAAQESPRVRNFSPSDYQGQNQNWSLTHAPEGWLWAGNNGGLLEFDGVRWQTLRFAGNQTVRAVAAGPNGEVFCGGYAEFGYWQRSTDGQLAYTSLSRDLHSNRLWKEEIWHIFLAQGCVYFQSFSVIYKYDFHEVVEIVPPAAIMFAAAVEGRVWVPTIGQGMYEMMPTGDFVFVPGSEALRERIAQFVVPNGRGGLWIGTTNNGIFEVQNGQCQPWAHPLNADFKKHQLNKALQLHDGGWAIGTILNGLYILGKDGRLRFHLNRSNGLQNNTVLALVEDRDGNLWVGLDRGIDFVQLHSPLTFFVDQTGKIGTVYAAAQWQGQLYLGTNQGVFSRPISNPGHTTAPFQLVEGSQGQVWQLQVFDNQLFCGHNSGSFLVEAGVARKISNITGGWCAVRPPGRAELLLQSTYTGLACFHKNAAGQWAFSHKLEGFSEPLREIGYDRQGNLWGVHPNRGLYQLRLSNDLHKVEEAKLLGAKDGLPADFYLDLVNIHGDLFVNNEKHPVAPHWDGSKARFDPLPGNSFSRHKWLNSTEDGQFFVADSLGLWLGAPGSPHRVFFPVQLVPRYENVVSLPDSSYLFCLENGYAIYNRRLQGDRPTSTVQSAGPFIRFVETAEGHTYSASAELRLPYSQNSLRIVFASPYFERAPRFSWFLKGFSKRWSDWQTQAEKEFTNLPEGRYLFQVKDDVSGQETRISWYILPPWYRSGWAYLAYACLALAGLWRLERYNRGRLERQRRRLEDEKEHEILVLEVENKNRELSNAAFNLIRKNEALQGLKDELLAAPNDARTLQRMVRHIDEHLEGDHDWEIFEASFNRVHNDFFKRLMQQYPDLTPGDLRLAAYLKMNLSSKEIAPLLNISIRGIENKRYRLRKKLGLPEEANLTEFIMGF